MTLQGGSKSDDEVVAMAIWNVHWWSLNILRNPKESIQEIGRGF